MVAKEFYGDDAECTRLVSDAMARHEGVPSSAPAFPWQDPSALAPAVSKAASRGDVPQLLQLLQDASDEGKGALMLERDSRGRIPLHGAAAKGHHACMELLLATEKAAEQVGS